MIYVLVRVLEIFTIHLDLFSVSQSRYNNKECIIMLKLRTFCQISHNFMCFGRQVVVFNPKSFEEKKCCFYSSITFELYVINISEFLWSRVRQVCLNTHFVFNGHLMANH